MRYDKLGCMIALIVVMYGLVGAMVQPQVAYAIPIFTDTFTELTDGSGVNFEHTRTFVLGYDIDEANNEITAPLFNIRLNNGSIGQTYVANSDTDPNFGLFASTMKNGVDDFIIKALFWNNGGGTGTGIPESSFAFGTPDLFGTTTELTSVSLYVQDLTFTREKNEDGRTVVMTRLSGTLTYNGTSPANILELSSVNPAFLTNVPEPSSFILLAFGLTGLAWWRRKQHAH